METQMKDEEKAISEARRKSGYPCKSTEPDLPNSTCALLGAGIHIQYGREANEA